MNEEERKFVEQQESEMKVLEQKNRDAQVFQSQQSNSLQYQERGMIKDQLDLSMELETIENLLRGNILKKDELGNVDWQKPDDSEMVILSEHGIHLIMNTITF